MEEDKGGITTRSKTGKGLVSDNTVVVNVNNIMADAEMKRFMKEIKEGNDAILSRVASIDNTLVTLTTKVDSNTSKLNDYISENDEEVRNIKARLDAVERTRDKAVIERKQLVIDNARLAYHMEKLTKRVRHSDELLRRPNILIEGAPENAGDTPKKILVDLLTDIGAITGTEKVSLDAAYRIGKLKQNQQNNMQ